MKGNHYSDNRRRRRKPIYVKKRRRRKRTSTVIAVLLICLILIAGAGAVGFFILQEYSKDHIRQYMSLHHIIKSNTQENFSLKISVLLQKMYLLTALKQIRDFTVKDYSI